MGRSTKNEKRRATLDLWSSGGTGDSGDGNSNEPALISLRKSILIGLAIFLAGAAFGIGASFLRSNVTNEADTVFAILPETATRGKAETVYGRDVIGKITVELQQLEQQKYELKRRAVEEHIREKVRAASEASNAAVKVAPETAKAATDVNSGAAEISSQEIDAFLKERNMKRVALSAKQLSDVAANLRIRKSSLAKIAAETAALEDMKIIWKIPLPPVERLKLTSGEVRAQNSGAPIEVVMVGNLHCPTCGIAAKRIEALKSKYGNKLETSFRFLVKEPDVSVARLAAEAAFCANAQKKFWELHDAVIRDADKFTDIAAIKNLAPKLGVDVKDFEECVSSRRYRGEVEKESAATEAAGVSGVPLIVVNGRPLPGSAPLVELEALVDAEL